VHFFRSFDDASFQWLSDGGNEMAFQKPAFAGSDEFLLDSVNISDTLSNLAHLLRVDSVDPQVVRAYAQQAEERLHALAEMLRGADGSGYMN
jgi:hypothetical protein